MDERMARRMQIKNATRKGFRLALQFFVLVMSIASLMPLYWMITGSFKIQTDAMKVPPEWFPADPTLRNYQNLFFSSYPTLRWFANSVITAGAIAFFATITSTLAGYSFGKKEFPGRVPLFWLFLMAMMLPVYIYIIPLFITVRRFHWIDTYWGLCAPYLVYPFGIFLMKQFMQNIPQDLIDAARMDGASELKLFWRIIFPLSNPVVGAVAIFSFMQGWNAYLWQLVTISKRTMLTLPVGVSKLASGWQEYDLGLAMAGATFAFLPMLFIFLLFQSYFVKGITMGAVKG